jgi:hypothetical protein
MSLNTHHIHLPNRSDKIKTLTRSVVGSGVGSVLLDGGRGGQSSYNSLEDYYSTANQSQGRGLSDKIGDRLSRLQINKPSKPKVKNIVI